MQVYRGPCPISGDIIIDFSMSDAGKGGLLQQYVPHLQGIATTNGAFATGDGIKLARGLGASLIDMDIVQVHPTGFSDVPVGFQVTEKRALILCAEILRGVGGVLLNSEGKRFVDELETRKAVTAAMNAEQETGFVIAIPPDAQAEVAAHMDIYSAKGLLKKVSGVGGVGEYIQQRLVKEGHPTPSVSSVTDAVRETFRETSVGSGIPRSKATQLPQDGEYMVGVVQPVLHYTMGGLRVSKDMQVLNQDLDPIPGLYAAGEVVGGTHGVNRLGGSSLLDCIVFGLRAADAATIRAGKEAMIGKEVPDPTPLSQPKDISVVGGANKTPKKNGVVLKIGNAHYELSEFMKLHPGGAIEAKNGEDITARFKAAHGADWELLEREEITKVDLNGTPLTPDKPEEQHHLAQYGGKGGSWRELLGRHAWFLFHSIAAMYPEHPKPNDKVAIRNFVAALGQLYPCKLCRKHLQQQLREMGPVEADTRSHHNL